jgi:arabinose-5-phosphate isomerase
MRLIIEDAKAVLKSEADSILNLMQHLDDNFPKAIDLILKHPGRLLVLGLGKSGHIGKKIAATLASTGQPSFFIHPTEAAHGDLGMMVRGDVCLMISHSGDTAELLHTVPAIKRMGLPIICITANPRSKLARYSDVVLDTNVCDEACPHNLAPTNSSTVALALGDALAVCLLKQKGFSKEQFALRHPAGMIGKRLLTRVSDIMTTESLPLSFETDSFRDALAVMTKGRQGVTIVTDSDRRCLGVFTDGDVRRALEKHDTVSEIRLKDIYTKDPKTIPPDALAMEAFRKMQDNKITSLIVAGQDGHIIGLVHIHHLLEQGFY